MGSLVQADPGGHWGRGPPFYCLFSVVILGGCHAPIPNPTLQSGSFPGGLPPALWSFLGFSCLAGTQGPTWGLPSHPILTPLACRSLFFQKGALLQYCKDLISHGNNANAILFPIQVLRRKLDNCSESSGKPRVLGGLGEAAEGTPCHWWKGFDELEQAWLCPEQPVCSDSHWGFLTEKSPQNRLHSQERDEAGAALLPGHRHPDLAPSPGAHSRVPTLLWAAES